MKNNLEVAKIDSHPLFRAHMLPELRFVGEVDKLLRMQGLRLDGDDRQVPLFARHGQASRVGCGVDTGVRTVLVSLDHVAEQV